MLVVGLGNPGTEYQNTRHNVGFMAVDALIDRFGVSEPMKKHKGIIAEGLINDKKLWFIKPQTFMNKSGVSVGEMARFYKIPLEDVIVLYDELDVSVGKIKIKRGGGSGGHNGIKSIDQNLGTDYTRIRIGIDHPGHRDQVSSYVLHQFDASEKNDIDKVVSAIVQEFPVLIGLGREKFLTKLALHLSPEKPKKQQKTNKLDKDSTSLHNVNEPENAIKKTISKEDQEIISTPPRNVFEAAMQNAIHKKLDKSDKK